MPEKPQQLVLDLGPSSEDDLPPAGRDLEPLASPAQLVEIVNEGCKTQKPTIHALRYEIQHKDTNGLAPFIRKHGHAVMVSIPGYRWWRRNRSYLAANQES